MSQSVAAGEKSATPSRKARLKARLVQVGNTMQKLNLAKLIDDMEHDQELADQLEEINLDIHEEAERKDLVREAISACQAEIESHLEAFLEAHPDATYENWIQDLHPDNVVEGKLLPDFVEVDHRFYVEESDHRLLWNERAPLDRTVPPRTYQLNEEGNIDLLDS